MYGNRKCKNCAYCSWKKQYCAAHDSDLGYKFMTSYSGCKDHRFINEIEDYEDA